jgi:hypothetical protein
MSNSHERLKTAALHSERARRRARRALLSVVLVAFGSLLACDAILGVDDEPEARGKGSGGSAASSGGEGGAAGGEGGAGTTGGVSGAAGDDGGGTATGGHGPATGGASGRPGTGGTSAQGGTGKGGAGSAGEAGGGGQAGADVVVGPTLNEPCEELDARACAGLNDRLVLKCEVAEPPHPAAGERIWLVSHTCGSEERCDPASGACREVHFTCTNYTGRHCTENGGLLDCETSPFGSGARQCPFGCLDGACLDGTGNRLIVHTEVSDWFRSELWPADIPVCFVPGSETASMQAFIREEVESTWGRYGNLNFSGFGSCSDGAEGVIVEFLEDCRGRLGSGVELGYPGAGKASHVGFCRTYRDARGMLRRMDDDEALTRFMARHQFGHVLGDVDDAIGPTVMQRGIEHPGADAIQLSQRDLLILRQQYGVKHWSSLVTGSGRCLALVGSSIQTARCASEAPQWWIPALDSLISFSDETDLLCTGITDAGDVDVEVCSDRHDELPWHMGHAQWSLPGNCVAPRSSPPAPGDSLVVASCKAVGDPTQSWFFEVYDSVSTAGYLTRIQFSDSGLCVTIPGGIVAGGVVPLLEPCGPLYEEDQLFYVRPPGEIAFGGATGQACLAWDFPNSEIYLWSCGFLNRRNNFVVSGAIESAQGHFLRVTPDEESQIVTAVPGRGLPERDQIFDWYF